MKSWETVAFPIGRYRLRFVTMGGYRGYLGSAWRGAFGRALKRAVCVTHLQSCADCILNRNCVYPYLFESRLPPGAMKMRRYDTVPHPFVLAPPSNIQSDDELVDVGMTLFGSANQHLPYVIHALREAGDNGIGRRRVRNTLVAVEQTASLDHEWREIYRPDESLRAVSPSAPTIPRLPLSINVCLLSPLRVRHNGHLMGAEDFSFAGFFVNVLRRISMLSYFYTESPLHVDFKALAAAARVFPVRTSVVVWQDLTRYSTRQQTAMQMGGLLGRFELPRDGIEPFWPYLWLGQWTHVGKFTSMGLGRYRLAESASLPDSTGISA